MLDQVERELQSVINDDFYHFVQRYLKTLDYDFAIIYFDYRITRKFLNIKRILMHTSNTRAINNSFSDI